MVGQVANFMDMYPAYKLGDVLNEYAVSFYALLSEGYRVRFKKYEMLSEIALLPNVPDKETLTKWFKQLEWATKHPGDILSSSGEASTPAEIKRALSGK